MKTVGVLALQGCVSPHRPHLDGLGVRMIEVRTAEALASLDGLILPGGESTAMLHLLSTYGLDQPLAAAIARLPTWGVCAGLILLARELEAPAAPPAGRQRSFGGLDITVRRNGYGRQLDSFEAPVAGGRAPFIRAPLVTRVGPGVEVLAQHRGAPVWLRAGRVMATTFHPELGAPCPSLPHREFVATL